MKKDQLIRPTKLAMPHPAAPLASEVIQICQEGPTYQRFVAVRSAISPFLGGYTNMSRGTYI